MAKYEIKLRKDEALWMGARTPSAAQKEAANRNHCYLIKNIHVIKAINDYAFLKCIDELDFIDVLIDVIRENNNDFHGIYAPPTSVNWVLLKYIRAQKKTGFTRSWLIPVYFYHHIKKDFIEKAVLEVIPKTAKHFLAIEAEQRKARKEAKQ